ncbi:hypothetical protein [Flavobacterium sp. Sd200]|uniref:hypothetical protein n=1 Tax=Flavobacterium sp. Sd200 TaxID=2692211 RepID=UPI001926EAC1|nr:hypothetical protein [Flavobacterium sp. Sd200]
MKAFLITFIALATFNVANGQTWSEWFNQNSTQKKYLLQQIAALKVYIGYAQRGYKIAKEGLTTIGNITGGEFDLHDTFFTSLRVVNPEIKKYARVADIIALQTKIMHDYTSAYSWLSESDIFHGSELEYIQRAYTKMLDNCEAIIDELIAVTTDGQLEMKDDERMARINALYTQMQDNWEFCRGFGNEVKTLAMARLHHKNDAITIRSLSGIKTTEP